MTVTVLVIWFTQSMKSRTNRSDDISGFIILCLIPTNSLIILRVLSLHNSNIDSSLWWTHIPELLLNWQWSGNSVSGTWKQYRFPRRSHPTLTMHYFQCYFACVYECRGCCRSHQAWAPIVEELSFRWKQKWISMIVNKCGYLIHLREMYKLLTNVNCFCAFKSGR